jgi:hypothetical protein
MRQALERVEEATTPTQVLSCTIERLRILMHSMAWGMLVGHRLLAGSNKSSYYDHRLKKFAVGSLPVRLDIDKLCSEEPKHRINNVCSRTLTGA